MNTHISNESYPSGIHNAGGINVHSHNINNIISRFSSSSSAGLSAAQAKKLLQKYGRDPTAAEIAREMGISEERVREIQKIAQDPVSLETPIGEEEDSHLGDFIEDETTVTPSDSVSTTMLKETLLGVLNSLTPREEKVLRLRYGVDDGRPRTLEEVGKEFNVTRERIRQIEAKALRKLRHPSRSKHLKDFLDT